MRSRLPRAWQSFIGKVNLHEFKFSTNSDFGRCNSTGPIVIAAGGWSMTFLPTVPRLGPAP